MNLLTLVQVSTPIPYRVLVPVSRFFALLLILLYLFPFHLPVSHFILPVLAYLNVLFPYPVFFITLLSYSLPVSPSSSYLCPLV